MFQSTIGSQRCSERLPTVRIRKGPLDELLLPRQVRLVQVVSSGLPHDALATRWL